MSSSRPERREEARFRVLRMLEENPKLTTREIAFGWYFKWRRILSNLRTYRRSVKAQIF